MTAMTGGCLCGQVRYQITAPPLVSRICWCKDCQYSSANGLPLALFAADQVAMNGCLHPFAKNSDSGNRMIRHFCTSCGTTLYSTNSARPGVIVLRTGTLDDSSQIAPSMNIWTQSAPRWACLDDTLDNVPQQPAMPASR